MRYLLNIYNTLNNEKIHNLLFKQYIIMLMDIIKKQQFIFDLF